MEINGKKASLRYANVYYYKNLKYELKNVIPAKRKNIQIFQSSNNMYFIHYNFYLICNLIDLITNGFF